MPRKNLFDQPHQRRPHPRRAVKYPDNTPGTALKPIVGRNYEVYVQDQYKRLNPKDPEQHKLYLTIEALEKKSAGTVLLNYASATKPIGQFVYIMRDLLDCLIQRPNQPIGWLLLDYANQIQDLPALLITSNLPSGPTFT